MSKAKRNRPLVLGHRGTAIMAPENTVPAFEFARDHQADILEMDVRLSRDENLIVVHDAKVDRTTDGSGLVVDKRLTELLRLNAGYRFKLEGAHPYRNQSVSLCTFAEVLRRFPTMGINVDIKDHSVKAVDVLAATIADAEARERVVLASFHHDVLHYSRGRYPWLQTSASRIDVRRFYWSYCRRRLQAETFDTTLYQLPLRYLLFSFANFRFIDAVHKASSEVHFWTINDPAIMRRLIELGADGIVTDRADFAREALTSPA